MFAIDASESYPPVKLLAEHCPAYILCGGQSARFGTDKARIKINGRPLLVQLASRLRELGHAVYFVADQSDRYADLNISSIVDAQAACGPMAGLLSAARHRAGQAEGWFLLLTCDQLHWQQSYFQWLANHARPELAAITYSDELIQPIPGLYHSNIASSVTTSLASRQLSIKHLLESLGDSVVTIEPANNPRAWCFNTPAELHNLLGKLGQSVNP